MPYKTRTRPNIYALFIVALSLCIISGCSNDVPEEAPLGTFVGKVSDFNNLLIPDIKVSSNSKSAYSNPNGWCILNDSTPSDRFVVFFEREDFIPTLKITDMQKNKTTQMNINMTYASRAAQCDTNNEDGHPIDNTIADGTGEITISAESLVYDDMGLKDDELVGTSFSGKFECSFTAISPSEENGKELFPDGFTGYTLDDPETLVPLVAYGFISLSLNENVYTEFPPSEDDTSAHPQTTSGKRKLRIADGKTAEIKIPIPPDFPDPPDTMGAWNVNKDDGYWYQVDTLIREGGVYKGEVGHFAFIAAAEPYEPSTVTGKVLEYEQGPGLEGAEVIITGDDTFNCWKQVQKHTDADGNFSIQVYPNSNAGIHVLQNGNAPDIGEINITTPLPGDVLTMEEDILACPTGAPICPTYLKAKFTLEWKQNPRDLNAMLVTPAIEEEGVQPHIWYHTPDMGSAKLVQTSIGGSEANMEVIEIYDLRPGKYKFSVHHYDGSDIMSKEAGVKATLVIEDYEGAIKTVDMTPVSGANGINDIWRLWDMTVEGDKVTAITNINSISRNENSIY